MSSKTPSLPISKSQFLNFTKCANSFYILNQNLYSKPQTVHSGSLEWHDFISLCQSFFKNAISIGKLSTKEEQQNQIKSALYDRKTIFHGYFESDKYASSIECLEPHPEDETWILYDFRPVGSQKLDILRSIFFQKKLLESLGIKISDCKVIIINTDYELFSDRLEGEKILVSQSVSARLIKEDLRFSEEWRLFSEYLEEMPFPTEGENYTNCKSPKSCYLPEICFEHADRFELFDLREGRELSKKYYWEGKKSIAEISDEDLNPIQRIQKQALISQTPYYDLIQLKNFFEDTTRTVAFLDFETINPTLPLFPVSRPFQHIPFLFSLHIWNTKSDTLEAFHYIHPPGKEDPRSAIIRELALHLPSDITIFSFNDFFEKQVIRDLVQLFSDHLSWWEQVRPNFKDLALPFKKFWIYSPEQKGKASLKDILPAFSNESHHDLTIKEGQDANYQYLRLLKKQVTQEEKIRVLEDLVSYCKMDTYGLFLIYKMLKGKLE